MYVFFYLEINLFHFTSLHFTLLHKRLYFFLQQSKCLYNLRFGFRPLHPTKHALITIMEQIKTSDKNSFTCGVFPKDF